MVPLRNAFGERFPDPFPTDLSKDLSVEALRELVDEVLPWVDAVKSDDDYTKMGNNLASLLGN